MSAQKNKISYHSLRKFKKRKCVVCGSRENLSKDHILPRSKGGITMWFNLMLLCETCNQTKGDIDPREWLSSLREVPNELREIVEFSTKIHENVANGKIQVKLNKYGEPKIPLLPLMGSFSCTNCAPEPIPSYYKVRLHPYCNYCRKEKLGRTR